MRLQKRTLIAVLAALLIVSAAVAGVWSYSTSRDSDINVMSVGRVKISLDEAQVDQQGVPAQGGLRTTQGNDYELVPGYTYTKDPTVTVRGGSLDAYIRVMITIHGYSSVEAAFGQNYSLSAWLTGFDASVWMPTGTPARDIVNDSITYELRYHQPYTETAQDVVLPPVFTGFTVPGSVTGGQLRLIARSSVPVTVEIRGHAIQKETFDTADDAWAAFDAAQAEVISSGDALTE